jgi:hypothetical protein
MLPVIEASIGISLIVGFGLKVSSMAALSLLVVFMAVVIWTLAAGISARCHCFGALLSEPLGWNVLVRDCLLAGMCLVILIVPSQPYSFDAVIQHGRGVIAMWPSPVDLLPITAIASLVMMSYFLIGKAFGVDVEDPLDQHSREEAI